MSHPCKQSWFNSCLEAAVFWQAKGILLSPAPTTVCFQLKWQSPWELISTLLLAWLQTEDKRGRGRSCGEGYPADCVMAACATPQVLLMVSSCLAFLLHSPTQKLIVFDLKMLTNVSPWVFLATGIAGLSRMAASRPP